MAVIKTGDFMTRTQDVNHIIQKDIKEKTVFERATIHAYEYMDSVNERSVFPDEKAVARLSAFDEKLPETQGDAVNIIDMLHEVGSPATVAQTGGRYFGFVNGGVTPAAVAAKWLADVWDQNAGLNVISPVASHLEKVCERWLKELFNLCDGTVAGFVSGTSTATLCGLVAARNFLLERVGWQVREKGLFGAPKIRVVLGEEAHSTVFKALSLIGFGMDDIEKVPVDAQGAMIADKMPDLDETTLVVAQAGNVNTGAFDDFVSIGSKTKETGAWLHIDGAFGLWAAGSENKKQLVKGMNRADSWSVDAHKTLNAPYDCGIILCRHEEALVSALQNTGSYIQYGQGRDGMLYTMDMSRRARSPELWATLKFFGRQGIQWLVDTLCENAQEFARHLESIGFTVLNDIVFNQVLVCCETDGITQDTLDNIQSGHVLWCGGSVWQGKQTIRVSVCSWATTKEDIQKCVAAFDKAHKKAISHPS